MISMSYFAIFAAVGDASGFPILYPAIFTVFRLVYWRTGKGYAETSRLGYFGVATMGNPNLRSMTSA